MTQMLVRVVVTIALFAVPAVVFADEPRVSATRQGRTQATVILQSRAVRVTQVLTPDTTNLEITSGRDVVRFTASLSGRVTMERAGRRRAFSMRAPSVDDQRAVLALVSGSPALAAFDAVMATAWARAARPAVVFRSAHALLGIFRGDAQPTAALVVSMARPAAELTRVRRDGPNDCWQPYSRDVVQYTYDLEACVAEARDSWLPWALAWCGYEYDLKTSLAFLWLLDCYGVGLL